MKIIIPTAAVIIICLAVIFFLTNGNKTASPTAAEYKKITPAEANDIINSGSEVIILDVRTEDEFAEGHIPGAILLPDYEIAQAEQTLTDKDAQILVYCRSGRRSANAAKALVNMGYTHVQDFGGIIDWPYEIEE